MVDAIHSQTCRAEHLRAALQPPSAAALLAVASDSERDLERDEPDWQSSAHSPLLGRLVARAGQHFRDQSLRSFRTQASVSISEGQAIYRSGFQEAFFLSLRAPSSPAWV